eukprot:7758386-Lingulodinium_polyedra.AAC.1
MGRRGLAFGPPTRCCSPRAWSRRASIRSSPRQGRRLAAGRARSTRTAPATTPKTRSWPGRLG